MIKIAYQDEQDGNSITLSMNPCDSVVWRQKRVYFEIWQSDKKTRISKFYEVIKGTSGNKENDFRCGSRLFSYELVFEMYRPNVNLVRAIKEMAHQLVYT